MPNNCMKKNFVIEDLEIIDIADKGKAIGKRDNQVVFVKDAIPCDVVDVEIYRKKHNYLEGRIINYKKHSEHKVQPKCKHFGKCGGCHWQNLDYKKQSELKQKHVYDCFNHIAKIKNDYIKNNIIEADKLYFYRNKLEFSFTNHRWLETYELQKLTEVKNHNAMGFHILGKFDKVLDIENCMLQYPKLNEIRLKIKGFVEQNNFSYGDLRTKTGLLRNIIFRNSSTEQIMIIVIFGENSKDEVKHIMNYIKDSFPEITSLHYIINTKLNDSINDLETIHFSGEKHIVETMNELKFIISPKSFFQTNSEQALKLYNCTKQFANIKQTDVVYDLYTGTGTIANFVAKSAKNVIGIEYVEDAINDAKINSQINEISNTSFYVGDMKDILKEKFIEKNGKPDVIITDPPRAGMHPDVVNVILKADAKRIVYVSCNPSTQARDIEMMNTKYKVVAVQPVDMFPHTNHIESICLLEKMES